MLSNGSQFHLEMLLLYKSEGATPLKLLLPICKQIQISDAFVQSCVDDDKIHLL